MGGAQRPGLRPSNSLDRIRGEGGAAGVIIPLSRVCSTLLGEPGRELYGDETNGD